MRIQDIIEKKKHGFTLSAAEINFFINGYVNGEIPDYQMAALLMAVWFRGMDREETFRLTEAMTKSGDIVDLSAIPGIKVDKHSTGGVADTTTLVAAPLVAACGGKVAKMSGRGLGHTGGTLDKLESIPGFSVTQSMERFREIVQKCGLSIIGQSVELAPADKKLYALRDVTMTIDNVSLIASSVMSKKLAGGSDAIVLDVKVGSGAFMKDLVSARELAEIMVGIGKDAGKPTTAIITGMDQPLGNAVGNSLEVMEAVGILKGELAGDLRDVSILLAENMLALSEPQTPHQKLRRRIIDAAESGHAFNVLKTMVAEQGGNTAALDDFSLLPAAAYTTEFLCGADGYLQSIDTEKVGRAASVLGAGRLRKEDPIDPSVGFWLRKRLGEPVRRGDVLLEIHYNDREKAEQAKTVLYEAFLVSSRPAARPDLIHSVIKGENV